MSKLKQIYLFALAALLMLGSGTAVAQQTTEVSLDRQIDMMRKDVRSQKKQIIAANLSLTDKEAEKFWPVYDQYTAELVKINDTKYALIKQYAQNLDTMTDPQYDESVNQWLTLDQSVAQLRLKYFPLFRNVTTAKNTALFFQLDKRLVGIIDLQLASALPLVQP